MGKREHFDRKYNSPFYLPSNNSNVTTTKKLYMKEKVIDGERKGYMVCFGNLSGKV